MIFLISRTYNYLCFCTAQMHIEISKELDFDPYCLKCGLEMSLQYSIGPNGELYMDQGIADHS